MTTKDTATKDVVPTGAPVQMRQAQAHLAALKAEATAAEAESARIWALAQTAHSDAQEKRRKVNALTELIREFPAMFGK